MMLIWRCVCVCGGGGGGCDLLPGLASSLQWLRRVGMKLRLRRWRRRRKEGRREKGSREQDLAPRQRCLHWWSAQWRGRQVGSHLSVCVHASEEGPCLVYIAALKTTNEDNPPHTAGSEPGKEVTGGPSSTGSSDTGVTGDMSVSQSLVSHVSPKPSGLGLLGSYSSDSDNDSTHSWR